MNAPVSERLLAPARRQASLAVAAQWLALAPVAAALGWRLGGVGGAVAASLAVAAVVLAAGWRIAARRDRGWLVRRLNAREAGLEDSAALAFAPPPSTPLARLQQARIAARVAALDPATLAEPWPQRRIAAGWIAATVATAAILLWPAAETRTGPKTSGRAAAVAPAGPPRLVGARIRVVPPAYTRRAPYDVRGLDVRAPAGSRIEWALRFAPSPEAAALTLAGQRLALTRVGDSWRAALRLDRAQLYRIAPAGGAVSPPHRLEAVPDLPPAVRLVAPASGLVQVSPGQRGWTVTFEGTDDYGVAPVARLMVTVTQGEGENVTFRERMLAVRGTGITVRRRFTANLDLAAFGLQPGGDLVAQLTIADERSPAQVVRGPGAILRWPKPEAEGASGLELMAQRTLPAYFRSQRQIIIDTEALIAARRRLAADAFQTRLNAIGGDQAALRTRYGQFMGDEAAEAPALPTADAPAEEVHSAGDGHDHGPAPTDAAPTFGRIDDVTADFGHAHDTPEAATLLDTGTRSTLRQALDAMWDSERALRQGAPQTALPHAYRALALIKQVQQATRIFLARVGPKLPPLDPARRMTGKREGIAGRAAPLSPVDPGEQVPAAAWAALSEGRRVELGALERWTRANLARLRDPLALLAAIETVRERPGCAQCKIELRGRLWSALSRPPAGARRRGDGGAAGRRYLQGLRP